MTQRLASSRVASSVFSALLLTGAALTLAAAINEYTGRFRLDLNFTGDWQGHACTCERRTAASH